MFNMGTAVFTCFYFSFEAAIMSVLSGLTTREKTLIVSVFCCVEVVGVFFYFLQKSKSKSQTATERLQCLS